MFSIKRRINFYHCDPAGVIFYGHIFFLCHSAYEHLISSFNLGLDYWKNDNFIVPIVHSSADFLKPLKNGDVIDIEVVVTKLKQSSFELSYECKNQKGDLCVEVKTVHVIVDKQTWKKTKMYTEIEEGLRKHLSEN